MYTIYIIFIVTIVISFFTGLIISIMEKKSSIVRNNNQNGFLNSNERINKRFIVDDELI